MDWYNLLKEDGWLNIKPEKLATSTKNEKGQTPLHIALKCTKPTMDTVKSLTSEIAITSQDEDGNTPLHTAYIKAQYRWTFWQLGQLLVKDETDNYINKEGLSTIQILIEVAPMEYLIEKQMTLFKDNAEFQTPEGDSILHLSVAIDKWWLAYELMEFVDVSLKNNEGRTVLHGMGLDKPVRFDFPSNNNGFETRYHLRDQKEKEEAHYYGQMLYKLAPKLATVQDNKGFTALHLAVQFKNWRLIYALAKYGAQDIAYYRLSDLFNYAVQTPRKTPYDLLMTEDCLANQAGYDDYIPGMCGLHHGGAQYEMNLILPEMWCHKRCIPDGIVEALLSRKLVEPTALLVLSELRISFARNVNPLLFAIPYMAPKDFIIRYVTITYEGEDPFQPITLCVNGLQFLFLHQEKQEMLDVLSTVTVIIKAGFKLSKSMKEYLKDFANVLALFGDIRYEDEPYQLSKGLMIYASESRACMDHENIFDRHTYGDDYDEDDKWQGRFFHAKTDYDEYEYDDELPKDDPEYKHTYKLLHENLIADADFESRDTWNPKMIDWADPERRFDPTEVYDKMMQHAKVWRKMLSQPRSLVDE